MVDYDQTVQNFFAEIIKYLKSLKDIATNVERIENIDRAMGIVSTIASNPKYYAVDTVRLKLGLEYPEMADAFIPEKNWNNAVWLAYGDVMKCLENLNNPFEFYRQMACARLLNGLKTVKYKNSTHAFKGIIYPFLSLSHFAAKRGRGY